MKISTRAKWILFVSICIVIGVVWWVRQPSTIPFSRLVDLANGGQVQRLEIAGNIVTVITPEKVFETRKEEGASVAQALQAHGVPQSTLRSIQVRVTKSFDWRDVLVWLLGLVALVTIWIAFSLLGLKEALKQLKGAIMEGISFLRPQSEGEKKTLFGDIAGYESTKAEMLEIIYYLQSPATFRHLGTEVPRNILMVGPPGTGKTLFARALADTAGVDIFYGSGSRFVELYVGAGAKHVRELFAQAKKKKRAVVFIDEIDALARKRLAEGTSGTHEHDNALNELLTQLDGFLKDKESEIIFIGATNREDVLDPALVQRMHRRIAVPLPKQNAREGILGIHKPESLVWKSGELTDTAARAAGFSGRELSNLMKESGRRTLHRLIAQAREQCRFGSEDDFWMIPKPDATLSSPFVLAGRMPAGPGARIEVVLQLEGSTKPVKAEVIDAVDGVWTLPQGLDAGHYNVSVSVYSGESSKGNKQLRLSVSKAKVTVEMEDVHAALERLGATIPSIANPDAVVAGLDAIFPGQSEAKSAIALGASFHYSSVRASLEMEHSETPKSGVLLIGPPGCGKTSLTRCLARYLGVPFAMCNIEDLADPPRVAQLFRNLTLAAQGNPLRAQYGIVCVQNCQLLRRDETAKESDHAKWQLLQILESLIRGHTVEFPLADGLTQAKSVRLHTGTIFFVSEWGLLPKRTTDGSASPDRPSDSVAHLEALTQSGLPKDLVEQSSVLAMMRETTAADAAALFDRNCGGNLAEPYIKVLQERGIRLEIEPAARQRLAEMSLARGDGLHGVNTVMRDLSIRLIRSTIPDQKVMLDVRMVEDLFRPGDPASMEYLKATGDAEGSLPTDALSNAVLNDQ